MFKKVILIWSILLLASLVVACGQTAPEAATLALPTSPPPAAPTSTENQPPEQPPPVDEAADGEEGNMVETFTGEGNETTPPFHVSGSEWQITWTIDTEHPENATLNLVIYCQDKPYAIWQTVSHQGGASGDVTYFIPLEANRDFFIKVIAQNLRGWAITVKDNHAEASACPVQITDIHYRGTVYPPDPENYICFERVEPDEYVVIKNLGDCYQDMSGWVLKNITRGFPSFTFPSGSVLSPGQIIRVYTDEVYPECEEWREFGTKTPHCTHFSPLWFTFYYGPGDIWDNEEPNAAVLYNSRGEEVSRKSYTVPTLNKVSECECK